MNFYDWWHDYHLKSGKLLPDIKIAQAAWNAALANQPRVQRGGADRAMLVECLGAICAYGVASGIRFPIQEQLEQYLERTDEVSKP